MAVEFDAARGSTDSELAKLRALWPPGAAARFAHRPAIYFAAAVEFDAARGSTDSELAKLRASCRQMPPTGFVAGQR